MHITHITQLIYHLIGNSIGWKKGRLEKARIKCLLEVWTN